MRLLDVKTDRIYHTLRRQQVHRLLNARRECWPRPIEAADHQDRTAYDPDPDALMQSERKTRDCGDAERRVGREPRFRRTRRRCDHRWPPWSAHATWCLTMHYKTERSAGLPINLLKHCVPHARRSVCPSSDNTVLDPPRPWRISGSRMRSQPMQHHAQNGRPHRQRRHK